MEKYLKELPFWKDLNKNEKEMMATCAQIRKYKKGEENKTAAMTYGIISGCAFSYLVVEALLIIWFAEGISHM